MGTVIATAQSTTKITCDPTGSTQDQDGAWDIYLSSSNIDYGSSPVADYRNTVLNGVGFKWVNLNSATGTYLTMTNTAINNSAVKRGIDYNGVTTFTDTWSLVKTGSTVSGVLNIPAIAMNHRTSVTGIDRGPVFTYSFTPVTVNVLACSITTPSVNVHLDTVLSSSFTGVNSTKGDQPFTIGLECDAGARINASLSFTQNTGTSDNSVIQLTGAGTVGVASGVGIQLLYDGAILRNNTNVVLKNSSGGLEFPASAFTARYFQTASTVTPGDANATATLNLTYQ
ncbi:fimbrial protein [Lelliottia sp. SL45]|uniref:fimbrial protein n=1 Tax=Lelliottia sp. SL45 TaxID=2994665 RepID=UPI00227664C3|nr:fimbrial protein [Lelliottia sp. SL45]MCY1700941.1 fimbrial protein [Lelliottia sp. SL45]